MANSALIPPEEWVTDPDIDGGDESCPVCSVFVDIRAVHRAWHVAMVDLITKQIAAEKPKVHINWPRILDS